jgi:hypothetical protein
LVFTGPPYVVKCREDIFLYGYGFSSPKTDKFLTAKRGLQNPEILLPQTTKLNQKK